MVFIPYCSRDEVNSLKRETIIIAQMLMLQILTTILHELSVINIG
jgi:hypothetical protein